VDLFFDAALPQALADAAQLQQAVLNLIVNAEQAIQQGRAQGGVHGRIRIRTCRLSGDRIGMEFSDDGPGIPRENRLAHFRSVLHDQAGGGGHRPGAFDPLMGLCGSMAVEVSVESQPGHGAKLSIELPALPAAALDFKKEARAATPYDVAVVPIPHPGRIASRPPKNILVVEDEPTVSQTDFRRDVEMGHGVDTLLDSREAFRRLKCSGMT